MNAQKLKSKRSPRWSLRFSLWRHARGERGLGLSAGVLVAMTMATVAAAQTRSQSDPRLSASNYSPAAQSPVLRNASSAPSPFSPSYPSNDSVPTTPAVSNPAPATELPEMPRILPPSEAYPLPAGASHPEAASALPVVATPAVNAPLPPNSSPAPPKLSLRQRWHYFTQYHMWGFPSQFPAVPLGQSLYQHGQTEVANGTAAFMVLYHYDFEDGSDKLNLHGRDQLVKIASLLPQTFFPIVIERTPEMPALAEGRRLAILHELAQGPFPVPPQRVVIGPSLGDDLRGVEAQLINQNVMIQTQTLGLSSLSGGGMGGSTGGSMGGMGGMGGGMGGMGGGMGGMGGMGGGMGGMGGMGGGYGR